MVLSEPVQVVATSLSQPRQAGDGPTTASLRAELDVAAAMVQRRPVCLFFPETDQGRFSTTFCSVLWACVKRGATKRKSCPMAPRKAQTIGEPELVKTAYVNLDKF